RPSCRTAGWWLDFPPEECAISLFPHHSGHHPGLEAGFHVVERVDASVHLRDVAVTEPRKDDHVEASGRREALDGTGVKGRRQAFPFERPTREVERARARIEPSDAKALLDERDQIAARPAPHQ